jgi:hypothetical protein
MIASSFVGLAKEKCIIRQIAIIVSLFLLVPWNAPIHKEGLRGGTDTSHIIYSTVTLGCQAG